MEMSASTFADSMTETWEPAARKTVTSYTVNSQQQQRHIPATTAMLSKEQQHITKARTTYACERNDGDNDDDDDDDDDIKDEKEDEMEARDNDVDEDDSPCTNMRAALRIRCVVDHVRGAKDFTGGGSCDVTEVEKEDDVIVASDTLLADLVQVALSSLGYSLGSVIGAQGAIQLKNRNWKPLPFDVITDDKTATIRDVLGNGKDFILRLRVPKKSEAGVNEDWRDSSVRHAVLSLLKHHSQSALAKLSPLSQSTISTIANNQYKNRLSHNKCQAFGRWYSSYVGDIAKNFVPRSKTPHHQSPVVSKTTFHPVSELPLLRSWFQTYPNPTNTRFNIFARILNSGKVRHNRPKISPQKIKIWWRNEPSQQREHQPQAAAAATSVKRTETKVSSTVMVRPASECKRRNVPVCSKTVSHVSKSVCREMKGVVARCGDSLKHERKDVAVQHELSKLHNSTEEGEVPELPCISSSTDAGTPSTDRKIPALISGSTTTEEGLPEQEGSSPSPPSLPHALTHTPHLARTMSKKAKKNPDMTFTFQGQGHALLPGQPPSTWQSSFMSWSNHKKSVQDRAAAVSSESAFLLPAWQHYLPFIVPHQDRSRSEAEQEVISSSSGCGFDVEVERYRYSQDLPFSLPSTYF